MGYYMSYFKQLKKVLVIAGLLGLLSACGEHGHEESSDDGEKKKEHSHSHG
jgi:hypothetical protein|tara:strand:- start:183 stop:335 length:153 start_codon:yes stop_codon:yes gene_type:complete